MPVARNRKPAQQPASNGDRKVLHPKVTAVTHDQDNPITVALAKQLIGWQEEGEEKFGGDYQLTDKDGKKVRLLNSPRNRPFTESLAATYAQDHLNKRWRLNGESIVVDKYGEVQSGQHRLVSVVLADQIRAKQPNRWSDNWPTEVSMQSVLVYGIDSADDTVNTLDTGKPRSLGDVLYRSEQFSKYKPEKRKTLARILSYAVRFLWHRTGVKTNAYSPNLKMTHSEAVDFIHRHPSLIKAAVHIYEEDTKEGITKGMGSPGIAAGLMYLMAASGTDGDVYRNAIPPSEKEVDLGLWDEASDFWQAVGARNEDFHEVRMALAALSNPDTGAAPAREEIVATLVLAWREYAAGNTTFKAEDISLAKLGLYQTGEGGETYLKEMPEVGGIDLGNPKEVSRSQQIADSKEEEAEQAREQAEEAVASPPTTQVDASERGGPKPGETKETAAERRRKKAEEAERKLKEMRANGKGGKKS